MFKNYLKIAWRNLFRNKVYSTINIVGLALGMAMALLIGIWISDELNVNKSFVHYEHIVQVLVNSKQSDQTETSAQIPIPLVYDLRKKFTSDIKAVGMLSWVGGNIISYGDKKIGREGSRHADPEMLRIISPKMLSGNYNALNDPQSMIINQTLANDLFGKADPMNKIVKLDNQQTMRITGVFEDFPVSSKFGDTRYFICWQQIMVENPDFKSAETDWKSGGPEVYILLQDHTDPDYFQKEIKPTLNGHARTDHPEVFVQPMSKWHLYADFRDGKNAGGAIEFVKMFGLIGFFVLFLACINFMNLSTARSERRAREVGIRKAVGSVRLQLIVQFLGESFLITTLAMALSLIIAFIALPWFNQVADKQMIFPAENPVFWAVIVGFTIITALIAGSYPAFYLSSFNAGKVLKGTLKSGRQALLPRKVLVVLQFTISIALIIGTALVFQEIRYARNRPTGYERKNLITVYRSTVESHTNYDVLRSELLAKRVIEDMAVSTSPTNTLTNDAIDGWSWPGKDPNIMPAMAFYQVSTNYGHTVKWIFKEGRDFSNQMLTDSTALVINEAAVKYMGLKQPVGTLLKSLYSGPTNPNLRVIGVIQDMIMESPFAKVTPTVYMMSNRTQYLNWMTIRLNPAISASKAIAMAAPLFSKYNPNGVLDYRFNDEQYAKRFALEQKIGILSLVFAGFAIFISCLGLFGLASFTAEQRTREVGIRKVLGASLLNLWSLLSKEFLVLVFISFCIALPLSYFFMTNWLQRYTYRTPVSVWIFIGTMAAAILITMITVSFQSIKASLANPIKSLRTE